MSNRKENIKKSLGLTEYPWSSEDDEDNPQGTTESVTTTSRRQPHTISANSSGTTGQTSPVLRPRGVRTRLESDLFWSLLNNVRRISPPGATPGPSRPSTSSTEPTESVDLTDPLANLQRILAIKRLSRCNNNNLLNSSRHCLHPLQPSGSSSWKPGSTPTMQADASGSGRTRKKMKFIWPHYTSARFRNCVPSTARGSMEGDLGQSLPQLRTPPSDSAMSDDEFETSPRPTDANQTNNNTGDQDQNGRGANTSGTIVSIAVNTSDGRVSVGANTPEGRVEIAANISEGRVSVAANAAGDNVSLSEDVVEIDEGEEENEPVDNVSNQAQASEEEDGGEETSGNPASAELVVAHGIKRKREGCDKEEPCTLREFNQCLLRLLECPVCMDWMEPPVTQCRRGHLVCGRCRSRLSACPVCRTAFSSVRNRAMEGVAEILRYPCQHGCGRESRLRRRAAHEASCAARRYQCPAPACADREHHTLTDLPQHFQAKHLSILKVGRRHQFSMKMNKEQHDNWLVMVASDLFHLRVDVDIRAWSVAVYVAYIGPKCNANNYTYEVSVIGQHNERKLVYTRVTHSDLESSSLNMSRQDCFHLTLDQALNFLRYKNRHCEPDKFLEFAVEINMLDVPVVTPRDDSDS